MNGTAPMLEPLAYRNGQFIPQRDLSISVADAGFVFGATATDFIRTYHGRLFRLDDHLDRFRESCRTCNIPMTATDAELSGAASRLIDQNRALLGEAELALIVFATPGALPHLGGNGEPTLAMHTVRLAPERYASLFHEGARLIVPKIRSRHLLDPQAKMRSRVHWWVAQQEVQADPHAWPLLLDDRGYVTETAAANFAIVRSGAVLSPQWTQVLNGISLRVTRELCAQMGIPFTECDLTLDSCRSADEALLTGTAFGLAGVRSINAAELRWPGPVTQRLINAWGNLVGIDLERQFG